MKVLYLCPDWGIPILGFKGASVHVREFVTALHAQGHEVTIIAANLGTGNPMPRASMIELAPVVDKNRRAGEAIRLGLADQPSDPVLRRELDKIVFDRDFSERAIAALVQARFAPDLIYERYALFHRAGAEIAASAGVPRLLEVNAPLIEEQRRYRGLRLEEVASTMEEQCVRSADHVITVSEAVRSYVISSGMPSHRVTCVPNGVDTARFRPDIDPAAIRIRHGLGQRPVIGFVGSLKPWHGVESLFEAQLLLDRTQTDPVLLIVGDGPGLDAARARADAPDFAGRVIIAGKVPHDEIPAYLAAMTVTVAPYRSDAGFYFSPLKILESLACGRPVIAPAQGQIRNLIDHGATGYLYVPDDVAGLAHCLGAALSNPDRLAQMARNAREAAETRFSWRRVVCESLRIARRIGRAA